MYYNQRSFHHSRRPRFDTSNSLQAIFFQLKDALPPIQYHDYMLEMERNARTPDQLRVYQRNLIGKKQLWLDECYGECLLRDPRLAELVKDKIFFDDHGSYDVIAWSIMPSHVHLILYLRENNLPKIIQKIKGYSAKDINPILGRQGQSFWDRGYLDRRILSVEDFDEKIKYLLDNPRKCSCSDQFTGTIPNTDYYKQIFCQIPPVSQSPEQKTNTWS